MEVTSEALARSFGVMSPLLDEGQRRLLAGAEATLAPPRFAASRAGVCSEEEGEGAEP